MIESVREDILKILEGILRIIKSKDLNELRRLSDHTIHGASIFQDEDSIAIAVITYALSKVLVSCDERILQEINNEIANAKDELSDGKTSEYKYAIKNLFKIISEINENFRKYIEEVIEYSEIKKGARIYEHGISMARAAEILGVSEWDLMGYVGKTTLIDAEEEDEKERLNFARKLFGIEK
ncbi:hypothetical protein COT47_07475 [Candidatus Woesearchaeota archaeon CG08_land_8_20_14_0_20_43_7]|nr:MAG: hypothetical protein COT47_07475 [Candidatus Woesearchaeota archaeon CG08_land_8_20_14_0_20_43_7]